MHTTIYFTEHHKVIEALLQTCEVLVACNYNYAEEIYGFICFEKVEGQFVLHYIYTKQTYRMLGIATVLLESSGHNKDAASIYSHHAIVAPKLASKYNFIYSPYIGLTADYRKPLEKKSKTEYAPEGAFVEKPEETMNDSRFKKEE